ncbi:uncharacterized protein VTP21DRAFT_9446 [Calcarisporiella thermophila]|uniref:uncharacterized protein n=1 Tax=Calcarisporiella thermophila TaxID=911321 RepID=UPI0037428D69
MTDSEQSLSEKSFEQSSQATVGFVPSSIVIPRASSDHFKGSGNKHDILTGDRKELNAGESQTSVEDATIRKRPRLALDNKEIRQRGQRMFGMILGTLNKFKNENSQLSETTQKRMQIEQKLQEKLRQEREEIAEIERLRKERKGRRIELREKESLLRSETLVRETRRKYKLEKAKFMKTKTLPHLYFLPALLSKDEQVALDEQKTAIEEEIKREDEEWSQQLKEREEEIRLLSEKDDILGHKESMTSDELVAREEELAEEDEAMLETGQALPDTTDDKQDVVEDIEAENPPKISDSATDMATVDNQSPSTKSEEDKVDDERAKHPDDMRESSSSS